MNGSWRMLFSVTDIFSTLVREAITGLGYERYLWN